MARADAAVGALLGAATARAAAHLVEINLAVSAGDGRVVRAARAALAGSEATERTLEPLTDAPLVRRSRAGDPDAWNELARRFSRYVHAIAARAYGLSGDDAEDVFQEVFVRTFRSSAICATTRPSGRGSPSSPAA